MRRPPRFFVSPDQIAGSQITVSGEDRRHIATVLRMKAGDRLLLSDGQGTEYSVKIIGLDREGVKTEILDRQKRAMAFPRVTLGQGLPKFDKMDFIVQKATELGVAAIVPLVTERAIVKVRDEEKRISRWQKICREAAMQSGRADIPKVQQFRTFPDFLQDLSNPPEPPFDKGGTMMIPPLERGGKGGFSSSETLLILPWEEGTVPIRSILEQNTGADHITVLIGPEGGFSSEEAGQAKEKGFHLVSLGRNILRTETAAVAVLSMILYAYPETDVPIIQ